MSAPKIDKMKLADMLRAHKRPFECARFFGCSKTAITKAMKDLNISVVKNVALENAHRVVDKNLNAIDQLQKINGYANELLDLLMRWNRGDDRPFRSSKARSARSSGAAGKMPKKSKNTASRTPASSPLRPWQRSGGSCPCNWKSSRPCTT